MNISLLLQDIAKRFSYRYLLHDGTKHLTYATLIRRADSISHFLYQSGCTPGSRVVVISNGRREYLEVLLGCVQAGIQFLPASVQSDKNVLLSTIRNIDPEIIFLEPKIVELLGDDLKYTVPSSRIVVFGAVPGITQYSRLTRKHEPFVAENVSPETPVIGMLLDGRIVETLTYRGLQYFLERHSKNEAQDGCVMLCIPYLHFAYAIEFFTAVVQGLQVVPLSHVSPKEILKSTVKYRVTELLMTPSLLRAVARDARFFGGDLKGVKTLRLGQCHLGPETAKYIKTLFSPNCRVVKMMNYTFLYAKLETTVGELKTEGNFLYLPINSVGRAVKGLEICAVDKHGTPLPIGKSGILSYRKSGESGPWLPIGETGYINAEGYVFLDCHNLPRHVEKPDCITQVLPGSDHRDEIVAANYTLPLDRFDSMMDDFSLAEAEPDPPALRARLASFILRNIQVPLAVIGIQFPLRTINMKLNTAEVMNEIDSSSVFYKLPDRFFALADSDVQELSCNDPAFPSGITLLYYPLHSVEGRLIGEAYFGLQGRADLTMFEQMQIHVCLRYLTSCLTSVERRLGTDIMLTLIMESLDMVSDGVGISDIGETPALLYTNKPSTQLIQLGKHNPAFGELLESNQTQNMYNLKYKKQNESSSSFFFKESRGRNIWINYMARRVQAGEDEYAICISNTQQEKHSVNHLSGLLSNREISVLELISAGLTNKEASEKLNVSDNTIKYHLSHIYRKLGVKNRAELLVSTYLPSKANK